MAGGSPGTSAAAAIATSPRRAAIACVGGSRTSHGSKRPRRHTRRQTPLRGPLLASAADVTGQRAHPAAPRESGEDGALLVALSERKHGADNRPEAVSEHGVGMPLK